MKKTIGSVLSIENGSALSDQLDSLKVMAEMLGYTIDIAVQGEGYEQEDYGVHVLYFYKGDTPIFKMTLAPLVKFTSFTEAIDDKIEKLKQEGKIKVDIEKTTIELSDGFALAQILL